VSRLTLWLALWSVLAACTACDKVPLLAPTESTVTLQINQTTLPINGTAEVIATVTEKAGTPVHNGTTVTFTASVGTIEPREARTEGGVARVTFRAGSLSGTAKVGAFSGAARATELEIRVGGAAAENVRLRLDPATVPQTGGTVNVIAFVTDVSGNPLPGAPVVFTTDNGNLGSSSVVTDSTGEARTTLTTNRVSVVRAAVGAKEGTATVNVVNLPSVNVTVSANPMVGLPVTFTVTPGNVQNGNPIQNVEIDFGDNTPPQSLGAISAAQPVQHVYQRADTYTVRLTVTDTGNQRVTTTTLVTVTRPVVTVAITGLPGTGIVGTPINFTVTVTNTSNVPIQSLTLDFGDQTAPLTLPPTGGPVNKTYLRPGTFTVTATATDTTGNRSSGQGVITIAPVASLNVTLDAAPGDPAITVDCPGTAYPRTCTTTQVGIGNRVIFSAQCNLGLGVGACANATSYTWSFGDNTSQTTSAPNVDHVFTRGQYVIVVTVQTNTGATGSQQLTLIVQ
jgi:PKD repeat protein